MPPWPVLSERGTVSAFERFGWRVVRSSNHIMMAKEGALNTLSIPNHQEISTGTLRSLIRAAGLTVEELVEALD